MRCFWIGWMGAAAFFVLQGVLSILFNKCRQCKKRYVWFLKKNRSTIFCSRQCQYEDNYAFHVAMGAPPEIVETFLRDQYPDIHKTGGGNA